MPIEYDLLKDVVALNLKVHDTKFEHRGLGPPDVARAKVTELADDAAQLLDVLARICADAPAGEYPNPSSRWRSPSTEAGLAWAALRRSFTTPSSRPSWPAHHRARAASTASPRAEGDAASCLVVVLTFDAEGVMSETLRRVLAAEFGGYGDPRRKHPPYGFQLDAEGDRHVDARGKPFDWCCWTFATVQGNNALRLELQGSVPSRPEVIALIDAKAGEYVDGAPGQRPRLSVVLTTRDFGFLRELAQAIGGAPPATLVRRSPPWLDREVLIAFALRRLADLLEREIEPLERDGRPLPDGGQQNLF